MDLTVLLALLAFCTAASAVDSEGTNFVFAFVRNANTDITNQVLTATVLNRNDQDCKFTLTYRPDSRKATPAENITQTVASLSAIEVAIPSWYGWNYAGSNVQDDVYLTLTGFSTCPVTVLANNYDNVTNQGDTYMVLPMTWGSNSFTFSLPAAITSASADEYEQVYVLPTTEGFTRVIIAEIGNAQSVFYTNATFGDAPAVYIGARTPDNRPRTYHVTSDKPVLIVAGVTCAGFDASGCDHIAYMPHPPAASDCYAYDYYDDDHISFLPTTSQFFTDIPGTCTIGQNISSILNDGLTTTMRIKPNMESPLWTIATTKDDQLGVAFHNGGSNIHIARYYDGTKFNSRGAFIATSPSITQFHNDYSSFYTRNANDSLEIYCTVLSCASLTLDGVAVFGQAAQRVTQSVDGQSYFIFVIKVAQPGFHRLDLDPSKSGNYAFFVFGKNGQYSYGYEGGANKPTFVLAPGTSPSPRATTPSAAPVTGSTPTIATVPTVTVPAITTATNSPITTATTGPVTLPTGPVTAATTPSPSPSTLSTVTVATPTTSKLSSPVTASTSSATIKTSSVVTSIGTLPTDTTNTTPKPATTTGPIIPQSSSTAYSSLTTPTRAVVTSAATNPIVTTFSTAPVTSTQPLVVTSTTAGPMTTATTQNPVVRTTATVPTTRISTNGPQTSQTTPAATQTVTTGTQAPVTSTTTQAPTTQTPVVTTTTQTRLPSSPTTPTPAPQTPLPTSAASSVVTTLIVTTSTPSTAVPIQTTATTQQQPVTTPTTPAAVTTPTTPVPVTIPTTPAAVTTPTTPAAVTTPTTPAAVTTSTTRVPVTTPTTQPAVTRPSSTAAATQTVATTSVPITTTQSSSVISLVIPVLLTIIVYFL